MSDEPDAFAGLDARLARHRERGDPFVDAVVADAANGGGLAWDTRRMLTRNESWQRLLAEPDDVQVSATVAAMAHSRSIGNHQSAEESSAEYRRSSVGNAITAELTSASLPWEAEDVTLLVRLSYDRQEYLDSQAGLIQASTAAETFAGMHGAAELEPVLRVVAERLDATVEFEPAVTELRTRVHKLLATLEPPETAGHGLVDAADDWGRRVLVHAEANPGCGAAFLLFSEATAARPTKRWLRACDELLTQPPTLGLVDAMLAAVADAEGRAPWDWVEYLQVLSDPNAVLVRGALWAAELAHPPWATERAIGVVRRWPAEKPGNTAIQVIGSLGEPEGLAFLSQLQAKERHKSVLKQIASALEAAAAKTGLSAAELRERLVRDFGLGADGGKLVRLGDHVAVLSVESGGAASLGWRGADGKPQQSVPTAVKEGHPEELRELRRELKEIREALSAERVRLEGLFVDDRAWSFADWRRYYLEHPLTGSFARRLIWVVDGTAAIPLEGALVDVAGRAFEPADDATVTLWHPLGVAPGEIAAWRAFVLERGLTQPFKQAHRELYVLTPAEQETATYSNRFAAHVADYPRLYALMRARGWPGGMLGPFEASGGPNARPFAAHGLRAEFWLDDLTDYADGGHMARYAGTDQVRFDAGDGRGPRQLADVPPIVFSEAMRDVDLFVAVTSIETDPAWQDRNERRFDGYWREHAFGELTVSAETRREVLLELIPKLAIAERCEVTDRFLVVRGDLRTYKLHLGSGNILMSPNDEYLCIVADQFGKKKAPLLPFEGDERLSLILSKAMLLAADAKITDRSITAQLR